MPSGARQRLVSPPHRKGLTVSLSVLLLFLITVSLAATALTFLAGYLFPQVSKSFSLPAEGTFCLQGEIQVYLFASGTQGAIRVPEDIVVAEVDGADARAGLVAGSIPGGASRPVLRWACGSRCPQGYHEVNVGTISAVQQVAVYCAPPGA